MNPSLRTAYLLWLPGLVGVSGLHRFHAGKTVSGVIWLLSFGLLGIGQLVDLFLIPRLISQRDSDSTGVPQSEFSGGFETATEPISLDFADQPHRSSSGEQTEPVPIEQLDEASQRQAA